MNRIKEPVAEKLRFLGSREGKDKPIAIHGCVNIKTYADYQVSVNTTQLALCGILAKDYCTTLASIRPPLAGYYQDKFQTISQKLLPFAEAEPSETELRLSYKDIAFLICMLHDYLPAFQDSKDPELAVWVPQIQNVTEQLSKQVEYDYEAVMERCRKRKNKQEAETNIGADGLSQVFRKTNKK